MYCRQCGYNNDQYSKLCHRCGSVLREAEDLYDKEEVPQEEELQEGVLKYARKSEDIVSRLKAPFRRLERATRNEKKQMALIIGIIAAVLCLSVWITVLGVKSCRTVEETVYGNTSANIAQQALAASDGEFVYYTCPFGSNPGLYRRSISTDEPLKISYICLDELSAADGWVYGTDSEGKVMRISSDGITAEQVINDTNVKSLTLVDNYLYYIGSGGYIFRADTNTVTRRRLARTEQLGELRAAEFVIHDDMIYYIELTAEDYNIVYSKALATGLNYTQTNPDISGADISDCCGFIRRMTLDGTEDSELLATPVMRLTAGGDYLYFQSETTHTVSYTDLPEDSDDDEEIEPITVTRTYDTTKCWRLELNRLKYSTMLEPYIADSPMSPADDGWFYYINVDGNLERTDSEGSARYDVLTYQQQIDRFSLINEWIYCLTDGGERIIRISTETGSVELLCERLEMLEQETREDSAQ